MISIKMLAILPVVLLAVAHHQQIALAWPEARSNSRFAQPVVAPPRLEDALSVAKSPLEPVTLALSLSDPPSSLLNSDQPFANRVEAPSAHKQTTRSLAVVTKEDDITPSSLVSEPPTSTSLPTTQQAVETTTTQSDSTETGTDNDEDKTTTVAPVKVESDNKASESEPSSSVGPELVGSSSTSKPADPEPSSSPTEASTSKPEAEKVSEASASTIASTSQPETVETSSPVAANAELSSVAPPVEQPSIEKEQPVVEPALTEPPSPASTVSPSASEAPEDVTTATPVATVATTTTAIATDAPAPVSEAAPATTAPSEPPTSTTAAPTTASPTSTTTTTTTEAATREEPTKSPACSFLPSYEPEELQKVYREETTFRNGTIKGKFTYINFDQRYRLVHYTRQPYGPVKIDLVEELSKPGQPSSTNSVVSSRDDIPNAELELRNILPNSLFGFPFVKPGSVEAASGSLNQRGGSINKPDQSHQADTFMYSQTGSGQNSVRYPEFASADKTGGPFAYSVNQQPQQQVDSIVDSIVGGYRLSPLNFASYRQRQLQLQNRQVHEPPAANKQQVSSYTYLTRHEQHPHSSPLPVYSSAYNQASPVYQAVGYQADDHFQHARALHQAHQPHSHEHFIAPFMFALPISGQVQPAHLEAPEQAPSDRLKLQVKTSKVLNLSRVESRAPGTKSAQLRQTSSHEASPPSPVQVRSQSHPRGHHQRQQQAEPQQQQQQQQHRQRAGKQNQELRATVNSRPVVYHVLANTNHHQQQQAQHQQSFAMAYDHDS